jgi:hypothetical protein
MTTAASRAQPRSGGSRASIKQVRLIVLPQAASIPHSRWRVPVLMTEDRDCMHTADSSIHDQYPESASRDIPAAEAPRATPEQVAPHPTPSCLAGALRYAQRGWAVLPLHPPPAGPVLLWELHLYEYRQTSPNPAWRERCHHRGNYAPALVGSMAGCQHRHCYGRQLGPGRSRY